MCVCVFSSLARTLYFSKSEKSFLEGYEYYMSYCISLYMLVDRVHFYYFFFSLLIQFSMGDLITHMQGRFGFLYLRYGLLTAHFLKVFANFNSAMVPSISK